MAKWGPSIFFNTHLLSLLIPARVDTLLITGCTTSGCVRGTVIDAASFGYRVAVLEEGVFDRREVPHRVNLFDMNAKYADVIPMAEVEAYLEKYRPEDE